MCSDARPSADERRRRRAAGFSILEGLVATAVLGIALMGFAASSMQLTRTAKTADSIAAATGLATEQLERLRALPVGSPQHVPGTYQSPNTLNASGAAGGPFARTWTVSANNTPGFGLKTVTVAVQWPGPAPNRVQLAGYVRCATASCP